MKSVITFLLSLALLAPLVAQEEDYEFVQLNASNGLSQSSVIDIAQDPNGLMWFGTRDGLNQYDGVSFRIFRSNRDDSTSLSNNDILDLEMAPNGDLWVGTTNGLNRYISQAEQFQQFFNEADNPNSVAGNTIREVLVNESLVWIGTSNGLSVFDIDQHQFMNFYSNHDTEGSLSSNQVLEIYEDSKGSIWIGTAEGLQQVVSFDQGNLELREFSVFSGYAVQSMLEIGGKLFIGTKRNGLQVLELSSEQLVNEFTSPVLAHDDVRALELDAYGDLWIGTHDGLNILKKDGTIQQLTHDERNENSISKNTIKAIFLDDQNSVWVGAYYGGVNIWNPVNFNFHHIRQGTAGTGLSYSVVSGINAVQDKLFIATEGGGITIRNANGSFDYLQSKRSKLPNDNVKALFRDENLLLAGTFNAGLAFYDLQTNKFTRYLSTANGLPHNSVYGITKLGTNYWIGTFGGGLVRCDEYANQVTVFMHDAKDNRSLSDDQVRIVYVDSKENLWIGTQNGLNLLPEDGDPQDPGFTKFLYSEINHTGEDILCIFEDVSGRIWAGTKEKGLYLKEGDQFKLIRLFDEIPNTSSTVLSIESGVDGDLWISSNNGILRYNHETGKKQLFEKADGLISNEYNSNASFKDARGRLYFGGPEGISYFSPNQVKRNADAPKVVLTDFFLSDNRISPRDKTKILDVSVAQTERIILDYDQSIFTIHFALPNYINPQKNRYAYRLTGLSDWAYTQTTNATYTIQEAGTYVFEVKGQNNDGEWSDEITALTIRVKPAPWETPLAFIGYTLVILLALYFLIKIIQNQAKLKHDLEIEHQINEQEKVINKLKLQFFTNISHEFRTPLTLIVGPVQKIIREFKGSSKLYKQILSIEKNAQQLLKLIDQLMNFRKLENKQTKLRAAEGNLVKFVKEVFISFQTNAKNEGYDYSFESSQEEIKVYYDRDKMERILYNLISNAFKFTPRKGKVQVKIKLENDRVAVSVADSGRGIRQEALNRIFDRFYRVEEETDNDKYSGTGIGLALVKGLVQLHRGTVEVQSAGPGEGSTFTIYLAQGKEHFDEDEIIQDFKDSEDIHLYLEESEKPLAVFGDMNLELTTNNKKKVLVVEDNDELRSFIVTLFDEYKLLEARNGKEAFSIATKEVPDLILSDVMMPEMDGIALCQAVKDDIRLSHIPVILLTARTSLIFKYEGLESGADDYINKPFNVRELKIKIRNLLRVVDNLRDKFKEESGISPSEVTLSSMDEKLMERAIKIVDDNISNEFFDVMMFCNELGVSRTMLFTKIKAWTNLTPSDFILNMRMKRAADLLEQSKANVSQVCFAVGYKNPKYFSKSFQKFHGLTPTKYAAKFQYN